MKIVQFIDSMYTGGAETSVCNTALEMKRQGLDITVLCFSIRRGTANEDRLDSAGVKTVYLGEKCLQALHLQWAHDTFLRYVAMIFLLLPVFRKTIRKEQPDVLHMHLDALLFYPFLTGKLKKKTKAFWTMHSDPKVIFSGGLLQGLRKRIMKRHAGIRVLSLNEAGKDIFQSLGFSNPVTVVRNGISMQRYRSAENAGKEIRAEFGIPEEAFVIGHIGRFGAGEAIKNQAFLVDVFSILSEKKPDAYLVLVGGGEPSFELLEKISLSGKKDKILMLSDRSDVPELLSVPDVFVLPSKYEGFPMTLIEAQAAGLRCVVSDTVTKEAAITEKVSYLPLSAGKEKWAEMILAQTDFEGVRGSLADYDIETVVRNLTALYEKED
ncbi:MAG: glycosyltransferase [Lachnospiraceae bacterium]|nr:glycosyltransferase [Lachnospiraceae bacterium]